MHQTRAETTKKIPIPRKGTKYVARANIAPQNSVPVVVAVRDMLKLARTAKEVNEMIKQKLLKINGRDVKTLNDSIQLFNIFTADKHYALTLKPTGRFDFEEAKNASQRICKVIGKKTLRGKKSQINLHDGSNILSEEKINVGDTIYLNLEGKMVKHVSLSAGKECFIFSGKYLGHVGKISKIEEGKLSIQISDKEVLLDSSRVIVR